MPTRLSVAEALAEADELGRLIQELLFTSDLPGDLRTIASHACFDVAVGHFHSIYHLTSTRNDVDSSVRALYRPLVETCYRSAWLSWIAPDAKIEALSADPLWAKWPQVGQIAECLDGATNNLFFEVNAGDILMAHDFTHCGRETIFRHFDENRGIGPSRDEPEMATLIIRAVILVGVVASMLLQKRGLTGAAQRIDAVAIRRLSEADTYPNPVRP